MSDALKEFLCWKCKFVLFLYKPEVKVVIHCPKCKVTNRAGVGSGKQEVEVAQDLDIDYGGLNEKKS